MRCICPKCNRPFECANGRYNRAQAIGAPLYCGKFCAGWARRKPKLSGEERRAAKAAYDRARRARLLDEIKAQKRAHYYANHERILAQERAKRPQKRIYHAEYCRQPEYVAKKAEYDKAHRAKKMFGPFADSFLALQTLESEIDARASRYEVYMQNGTINKALMRRRAL
jgi:hypothetical protein